MRTLLRKVRLMPECGFGDGCVDVLVDGTRIAEIAPAITPNSGDSVVDGRGISSCPVWSIPIAMRQ